MKTAQQAQSNWTGSAGRAQTAFTEGVQNFSGDWAGNTVRQEAVLVQNFQQAVARGDWRDGINRVGTGGWKSATQAKAANYGVGLNAGAAKFASAITKILNAEANIVGSLPPRGTYEQNKARANAVMDGLHALKGQLGA